MALRILLLLIVKLLVMEVYAQSTLLMPPDTTTKKSSLVKGVTLEDVEVVGKQKFGIESSQMSAIQVTPLQIKRIPVFMGTPDVLKALQKLPGVTSEGEGTVGLSVRGGKFDQNLITLDGATLYNPEHLKSYASAINPDMIGSIDFYRGAFPARYGSRLSSIIDINMKEGDFKKYHGTLFIGMLSSSLSAGGPIWKDHTSFMVGGRLSYFNFMAYPILEKVYESSDKLQPYSDMKYFDINAKITHKFSERNKLSATLYYGKDNDNAAPTDSKYKSYIDKYATDLRGHHLFDTPIKYTQISTRGNKTECQWSNLCAALNWDWKIYKQFSVSATAAYSKYDYSIIQESHYDSRQQFLQNEELVQTYPHKDYKISLDERDPTYNEFLQIEDVNQDYYSKIKDFSFEARLGWTYRKKHNILLGAKMNIQLLSPLVRIKNNLYYKDYRQDKLTYRWYVYDKTNYSDTIMGNDHDLKQYILYAEDDFTLNKNMKFNIGLRMAIHSVTGKTYFSWEPRLSFRWKFLNHNALKLSYSQMAQSIHRLATNNLSSSSELWVPITKDIPLMKSYLYALGYVYEFIPGVSASIEGYYKTMNDIIEYSQNANYALSKVDWSKMVSVGKGRSYGVEFMLEKSTGNTTGWISYTWSKALHKFDEAGNQINAGREFYASNDRRHNFNMVLTQKVFVRDNAFFEFNASWTYLTGRRGTIPIAQFLGGRYAYYDGFARYSIISSIGTMYPYYQSFYNYNKNNWHIYDAIRAIISTRELNHYVLPAIHHLDLNVNYSIRHKLGESIVGLSLYNVYNRKNANTAYVGINENKEMVLKCQCPFPFMPSLSYTHKF